MFRQGLADRLAASGARFRALSTASKISLLFLVFRCFSGGICPLGSHT